MPAWRLSRLSKRSPATEMTIVTPTSSNRLDSIDHCRCRSGNIDTASNSDASKPPKKPSQLFPGLMRGASLCLPNCEPTK